jgi:MFS transporter, PPP family, 3-phenylpropionic acid transporter
MRIGGNGELPKDGVTSFAVRVSFFYAALFVFYGVHTPFLPVWLDWRGLTAGEISLVIAAPLFLRAFASPLIAATADLRSCHRRYLVGLAWLSFGFAVALAFAGGFATVLTLATLLMLANSSIMPLIETIAVNGVRVLGLDYGRMRLWGSVSFVAANFAGGFAVSAWGGGSGIWLIAFGCLVTLGAGYLLPRDDRFERPVAAQAAAWRMMVLRELLTDRRFVLFLVAAGLVMSAHATFFTFGVLLWSRQGLGADWAGSLWAAGVIAEVAVFSVSRHAVLRLGATGLIIAGAAASIVRWGAMGFGPGLWLLVPLQALHGATYGATHIGAIHFIHDTVPRERQATAQALYATIAAGVGLGAATLIAGWSYQVAGAYSYFAMALISAIALTAGWRLRCACLAETLRTAAAT